MKRVLVIEHDPDLRAVLEGVIVTRGCAVELAYSFETAKQRLSKNKYDVVFADHWTTRCWKMYELLESIGEETELYIMSSLKECREDLQQIKYTKILDKPFSLEDLDEAFLGA